jgi:tRNA (cytidine/uridine-2'-O-)-methyltransferase
MPQLALYAPEIPHNTGTLIRTAACWGVKLHVIHPLGFALSDRTLRRAHLDYFSKAILQVHENWEAFCQANTSVSHNQHRLIALTPHARVEHHQFVFGEKDILIVGQESKGLPLHVQEQCHQHVRIPMVPDMRSLNLAIAGAVVLAEALRQTNQFP